MKRIAIFLPSLDGGGAQRVVLTLANALADTGENVDLVLVRAEGPFLNQVHPAIRLVNLDAGRAAKSLPKLVKYIRRERPFALLSSLDYINIVALMARALSRKALHLVVGEHNTLSRSPRNGISGRIGLFLMRVIYPAADVVVAVSHGVADDLSDVLGLERDKIRVIYNPVVTPEISQMADSPLSHPWFEQGAPPVIIGIGRLTRQKDFANLILAFSQIRQRRDARLLILGEGELRLELEQIITSLGLDDSISLPGFVDNPFAYLSRAALFVLSSRWEGLPTVLIEAMACGTPVVATDCPSGPSEILESGKWGRLVPVADPQALAGAISLALDDQAPPMVRLRADDFRVSAALENYREVLLGGI